MRNLLLGGLGCRGFGRRSLASRRGLRVALGLALGLAALRGGSGLGVGCSGRCGFAGARFRDSTNGAFWLYDGNVFWTYDDPTLVGVKGSYVKANGLGGLTLWSADGDDGSLVTAMFNSLR